MIIISFLLFLLFFGILIKCAGYSIKYSSRLAKAFNFPEFLVSFLVIALISVLPEATVSILSALRNEPGLSMGTLLGSNIADLTLVMGVASLFSFKGLQVKSKILKNNIYYLILLFFPLLLGVDGTFSRTDGLILILIGFLFFGKLYLENHHLHKQIKKNKKEKVFKSIVFLIISLTILLVSAFYTVQFALKFAYEISLPAVLIGITILAIGTCLPELIFSIRAVKKNHDDLALGDILGTVITDSTIILGIVALISPFSYNPENLYITGMAMFLAGVFVTRFMKSEKDLTKFEGVLLILLYILFVAVEFFVNTL